MCREERHRSFALPTQGRDWALFCQSGRFTAGASQHWERWGSTAALASGTINVTRRELQQGFQGRNLAKFYSDWHRFPVALLKPSCGIVVRRDPLHQHPHAHLFGCSDSHFFSCQTKKWGSLPYAYLHFSLPRKADSRSATCNMLRLQFASTLVGCHFEIPVMNALSMQIADATRSQLVK